MRGQSSRRSFSAGMIRPSHNTARSSDLAEEVDVGNRDRADLALVFSDELYRPGMTTAQYTAALAGVIEHEAGHLLGFEHLDGDREGLDAAASILVSGVPTWQPQGPAPISQASAPINPNVGAVQDVVVDPDRPDTIYIATVNGGVWKTTNGTNSSPNWTPLTDQLPSLSTSAITIDLQKPSDASKPRPVYVGTGSASNAGSLGRQGDTTAAVGLLRTLNGGSHLGPRGCKPARRTQHFGHLCERQVHGRGDRGPFRPQRRPLLHRRCPQCGPEQDPVQSDHGRREGDRSQHRLGHGSRLRARHALARIRRRRRKWSPAEYRFREDLVAGQLGNRLAQGRFRLESKRECDRGSLPEYRSLVRRTRHAHSPRGDAEDAVRGVCRLPSSAERGHRRITDRSVPHDRPGRQSHLAFAEPTRRSRWTP